MLKISIGIRLFVVLNTYKIIEEAIAVPTHTRSSIDINKDIEFHESHWLKTVV